MCSTDGVQAWPTARKDITNAMSVLQCIDLTRADASCRSARRCSIDGARLVALALPRDRHVVALCLALVAVRVVVRTAHWCVQLDAHAVGLTWRLHWNTSSRQSAGVLLRC